jgi:hypothetical protein
MSPGLIYRVTVGLAADQNENARCDGKNCQYRAQASESRDNAASPVRMSQMANSRKPIFLVIFMRVSFL